MRKHIKKRRERLRKLGEQDAAMRCAHCKKDLAGWVEDFLEPGRFCDDDCMEADKEARRQLKEARR